MAVILGDSCCQKVEIIYPLYWNYKVILLNDEDAKNNIEKQISTEEFKIDISKNSFNDKYTSYNVNVLVSSDAHRTEVFSKLKTIAKFVV